MAKPSDSAAAPALDGERSCKLSPEAGGELRRAIDEMDRGEYIELTPDQLDRWALTGERPWQDESLG